MYLTPGSLTRKAETHRDRNRLRHPGAARHRRSPAPDRRRTGGARGAGHRGGRPARRRGHGAVHRPLPQGGDRRPGRRPAAHAGRAAALPARAGRAAGGHPGVGPRPGQARRRADRAHHGRGFQGPAGGHLPALQAQAPDQGAGRPRGRAGTARRPAAGQPGHRPGAGRRGLRGRRARRGRRGRRAGRRPGHPGRAVRRGRRPDRRAPGADVVTGPAGLPGPRGPGRGGREVRRLLRVRGGVHRAALAPDPGHDARGERRNPRSHHGPGRAPG